MNGGDAAAAEMSESKEEVPGVGRGERRGVNRLMFGLTSKELVGVGGNGVEVVVPLIPVGGRPDIMNYENEEMMLEMQERQ